MPLARNAARTGVVEDALYSPFRGFWSTEHGWTRHLVLADSHHRHHPLTVGFRPSVAVYRVAIEACYYLEGNNVDNYLRSRLSKKQWDRYNRLYARQAKAPSVEQIERAVMQTGDWFALQCGRKKGFFMIKRSHKDCLQKGIPSAR